MIKKITLEFPADPTLLEEIREAVHTHALNLGLSNEKADELTLAVDELISNVIEHSYESGMGPIFVTIDTEPDKLKLMIEDFGKPFPEGILEQTRKNPPNIAEMIREKRDGGVGLYLMMRMLDRLEYKREDNRNVWILEKHKKG